MREENYFYEFLLETDLLRASDKNYFRSVNVEMEEVVATIALHKLCEFLSRYYGKKMIFWMPCCKEILKK